MLAAIAMCGLLAGLRAQHPLHYPIDTESGLPSNEVFELVQDPFGHVWIGCNTGLYRYDGIRFKRHGSAHELNRAMIQLSCDSRGRVWCANNAGQYFVVEADSLRLIYTRPGNIKAHFSAFGPDGDLLVVTADTVRRIDAQGRDLQRWTVPLPDGPLETFPIEMRWTPGAIYLAALPTGLLRLDLDAPRYHLIQGGEVSKLGGRLSSKGDQAFCSRYTPDGQILELLSLSPQRADVIYRVKAGANDWLRLQSLRQDELWVCTRAGAFRLRKGLGAWAADSVWIPSAQVSAALHDREGNLWLSSLNQGLFVFPSLHTCRMGGVLSGRNLSAIAALPDQTLLLGTFDGEVLALPPGATQPDMIVPKEPGASTVKRIRPTEQGALLVRSVNKLLDWPSGRTQAMKFGGVRDIALSRDSSFWIGSSGLYSLPRVGWEKLPLAPFLISRAGRLVEHEAAHDLLYAGFNDGLVLRRAGKLEELSHAGRPIIAMCSFATAEGIWFGTLGHGLLLLRAGKVVRQIDKRHGLPAQTVRSLWVQDSTLVFGTDSHLGRIHLPSGAVHTLSRSAGFSPSDINQMAVAGDRIWLATTRGLIQLPLAFAVDDHIDPPVRIESVTLNDVVATTAALLDLPPSSQNLRVEFQGLSFRSRGRYGFEYRLLGLDSAWTYTDAAANAVVFNALPAGSFTLEVRTVEEGGHRSPEPARLSLRVRQPYYLRLWFWFLCAASLVGLTIGGILWRVSVLRRKERIQHQLIASQLTALKAQMNPHFLFNALNSIQDLVLSKDIRNSHLYLGKFSNLMRKVLEASGHEWVALEDEMAMLGLYLDLEQLRFGEGFQYSLSADASLTPDALRLPSLIIQPFVENAVKHGLLHKKGDKRLQIHFEPDGSGIRCVIQDNGVGRRRSAEIKERSRPAHRSFSTGATRERLDLIRHLHGEAASLQIEDLVQGDEALGTRVVIRLPIQVA